MPWSTFSGVMRLSRPASSSGPNSPQLLPGGRFRQRGVVMGCVPPLLVVDAPALIGPEDAMPLLSARLYDALRATGVPERLAHEAAEEVAEDRHTVRRLRTEIRVTCAMGGLMALLLLLALGQIYLLRGEVGALRGRLEAT